MTIGTPLWDEFVANLKEVKVTVEDMGFMPDNFPCESELKSMTAQQKVDIEQRFIEYYKRYAFMSTKIVHNDMYVKVAKVNEEVRNLYYNNFVNLDLILNKIGDDFLKYTINMSELCNIKKIKATCDWYKYFCQIVGCEYNPEYKPSKLKDTKGLEKEFYFLFQ